MINECLLKMIEVNKSDPRRINHTLKVYALTQIIAKVEISDVFTQNCAIVASVLHDIGIQRSLIKYKSSAGNYQQIEGPPIARNILQDLNCDKALIERVCFIIANHHTYNIKFGVDHQVLIEADIIVNLDEEQNSKDSMIKTRDRLFKTKTGIDVFKKMLL